MNPDCQLQIEGVCTTVWGLNRHHRKLRKQGGTDDLSNIIVCCGSGTTGCHGYVHANPKKSRERGWLVPSWDDPTKIPWSKA